MVVDDELAWFEPDGYHGALLTPAVSGGPAPHSRSNRFGSGQAQPKRVLPRVFQPRTESTARPQKTTAR